MNEDDESIPNRLQGSSVVLLGAQPLIGVIELQTDEGLIPIAINRGFATELAFHLISFLGTEPDTEVPIVANDG